jgi:hypothetical protein
MKLLTIAGVVVFVGCAAQGPEFDDDDHVHEEAPSVASQDAPLISTPNCQETTETAYSGGRAIGSIKVITIGGKKVTKTTGHAFLRLQKAAHDAGVYVALNSGFRTQAEQQYFYGCYVNKNCNGGNLAARPGYSNHQSGWAVDVTPSSWLNANAKRFGFEFTVPSEPWHIEYRPDNPAHGGKDPGGPCGGGTNTPPPNPAGITWVSPLDGGSYTPGIWMKAKVSHPKVAKVKYFAEAKWDLGESSDKSQDFAVRYVFNEGGQRSIMAVAYDNVGTRLGDATIRISIVK